MLNRFKNLLTKPEKKETTPVPGNFARPVEVAPESRQTNLIGTINTAVTHGVIDEKTFFNEAAAACLFVDVPASSYETDSLLRTGTDSRVVVPLSAARGYSSGTSDATSPMIGKPAGTLAAITQSSPFSDQPLQGLIRRNIKSEADLMAVLGRPWRGILHGVVAAELANQCLPLDMHCGQVAVVITDSALAGAHWTAVRKRIESDWSYKITEICVLPNDLTAKIHARCVADADRNHGARLTQDNSLLRAYDDIVDAAIAAKASDIHFETSGSEGIVRLRVYGALRPWLKLPSQLVLDCLGAAFGLRMKTQTATKEAFNAQNPVAFMTTQTIAGVEWDGRVNGRPHATGYKAVMRLLESNTRIAEIPTFEGLGYNPSQCEMFDTALARQWGLIIAFGSTGEGKSTTLRSMLVHLPGAANLAIYSVESPVEYKIPNVCQFNVPIDVILTAEEIARKFTAVLRDVMREDPDALMVAEVRDHETANLAIEFTTTGHRCFTTLHAEGAIDGLARMTGGEMRIPADTLAGSKVINCGLYQKLLPLLCPHCKLPTHHAEHGLSKAKRDTLLKKFQLDPASMYVANTAGCPQCKPTVAGLDANGTKGVAVAAEIFIPTAAMLPLIAEKKWPAVTRLWRGQRTTDFSNGDMRGKTAFEHGLWLVANGKVSLKDLEAKFETIESYEIFEIKGAA